MNDKTRDILFAPEVPDDLFSNRREVPFYDLIGKRITGKTLYYPLPYNAVHEKGSVSASLKAERYLFGKLNEAGYTIWKPVYEGEEFTLLVENGGKMYLIVFVLDSESERKVWRALELRSSYSVVVVRDRRVKEPEGVIGVTLDEAFDSFNFLSR
jgi:hypothetical protein